MNGALRWIAASPLGSVLAGLVVFFVLFLLLGQNVPLTGAAFGAAILGLVILVRPEYGVHFLLFHFVVSHTKRVKSTPYWGLGRSRI